MKKGEVMHQELLGSFARAVAGPETNIAEAKLVAAILGIYQMITATETDHGNHDAHANGIAALMKIRRSPVALLTKPQSKTQIVFSIPAASEKGEILDDLLIDFDALFRDPATNINELITLDQRFAAWQDSRAREFKPTVSGYGAPQSDPETELWSGRVDT